MYLLPYKTHQRAPQRLLGAFVAICLATLLPIATPAYAQSPAPGWYPTGEWRCGPHVRIITSTDGKDGVNFEIIGAWFNNNYTLRRGQLFYNGVPCAAIGRPFGVNAPRQQNPQSDDQEGPDSK